MYMDSLTNLFLSGRSDRLVLKILCKIHVATRKQLCRFLALANPNETEEAHNNCLNALIKFDLLSLKTCRITSGLGEVRTRSGSPTVQTDVYYLTEPGLYSADVFYQGIGRYARAGEPQGVHALRIYHDLLICEAFLHACSIYDVTNFQTEAELKSIIFHARNGYKNKENTGDYRVHYLRHDGAMDSFDGEVILQSKGVQIEGKPSGIVFYTDCAQTADRIQEFKGAEAFILKNVLENRTKIQQESEETIVDDTQLFTNLEQKALALFEQFPIGMDAETVGILLKIHRANASSCLKDLARKDALCYQYLRINNGRPVKLYCAKTVRNCDGYLTRKLFYSYCLLLRLIAKNNTIVERFNKENNTIIVANSSGKRMLILVDNMQTSVRDNVLDFNVFRRANVLKLDGMKMFYSDLHRFEGAVKLLSSKFLLKPITQ